MSIFLFQYKLKFCPSKGIRLLLSRKIYHRKIYHKFFLEIVEIVSALDIFLNGTSKFSATIYFHLIRLKADPLPSPLLITQSIHKVPVAHSLPLSFEAPPHLSNVNGLTPPHWVYVLCNACKFMWCLQ